MSQKLETRLHKLDINIHNKLHHMKDRLVQSNLLHHKFTLWSLAFLLLGLLINLVVSLWEGSDIGFFSANTVFTALSTVLFCTGVVARLSRNYMFYFMFGLLGLFNLAFSLQPIIMWTDEGNLCGGLSATEQQIGRECYSAALGAVTDGATSTFDNLITLVTTCYSNNNILTSASGVCYNIRWGQSNGSTLRAFMLISWLLQFFGSLIAIVCGGVEAVKFQRVGNNYWAIENYLVHGVSHLLKTTGDPNSAQELETLFDNLHKEN